MRRLRSPLPLHALINIFSGSPAPGDLFCKCARVPTRFVCVASIHFHLVKGAITQSHSSPSCSRLSWRRKGAFVALCHPMPLLAEQPCEEKKCQSLYIVVGGEEPQTATKATSGIVSCESFLVSPPKMALPCLCKQTGRAQHNAIVKWRHLKAH